MDNKILVSIIIGAFFVTAVFSSGCTTNTEKEGEGGSQYSITDYCSYKWEGADPGENGAQCLDEEMIKWKSEEIGEDIRSIDHYCKNDMCVFNIEIIPEGEDTDECDPDEYIYCASYDMNCYNCEERCTAQGCIVEETPLTYMACSEGSCVETEGEGDDECTEDTDCQHQECVDEVCTLINEPGEDTCTGDEDCASAEGNDTNTT